MSDPRVEPIRVKDEEGRLIAAGVNWLEYRLWAIWLLAAVGVFFALPLLMLLVAMVASGFALAPTALFFGDIALLIALFWFGNRVCLRARSSVFHDDGTIEIPEGLPTQSWIKELSFPYTDVSTIEERKSGRIGENVQMSRIDIYSHEGDWVTLGHNIDPQICHAAVVQLTKALAEIREAVARPEHRFSARDADDAVNAAMAGLRSGESINVIID